MFQIHPESGMIVYGLVIFTDIKATAAAARIDAPRFFCIFREPIPIHTCNSTLESVDECHSVKAAQPPTSASNDDNNSSGPFPQFRSPKYFLHISIRFQ